MTRKLTLLVPDVFYRQIKEKSFKDETTMTRLIISAVEKSMEGEKVTPAEASSVSPPVEKVAAPAPAPIPPVEVVAPAPAVEEAAPVPEPAFPDFQEFRRRTHGQ